MGNLFLTERCFTSHKHIICETPLRAFLLVFIQTESSSHFCLFPLNSDLLKKKKKNFEMDCII